MLEKTKSNHKIIACIVNSQKIASHSLILEFIYKPKKRTCIWKYFRKFKFLSDLEKLAADMAKAGIRPAKTRNRFINHLFCSLMLLTLDGIAVSLVTQFTMTDPLSAKTLLRWVKKELLHNNGAIAF